MKAILPILLLLAFAARPPCLAQQAASPGAPQPASVISGEELLDRVVATVDAQHSISAKLRHRVELVGKPLIGTGSYAQQGRGPARSFRFELEIRTSLFATSVLHICDGHALWMIQESDGNKRVAVVNMDRLQLAKPKTKGAATLPQSLLSLAGLPKLLTGLQESFVFDDIVESRLDDLPVWSLAGTWDRQKLVGLLPDQKAAIESGGAVDLTPLESNLPHRVVLHVGCDDLFPYRLEYWRSEPSADGAGPSREKLIVVLELYEVQLGARLDPLQFTYRPDKNVQPIDQTKEFLDRFGLEDPPPEEARRQLRSPL